MMMMSDRKSEGCGRQQVERQQELMAGCNTQPRYDAVLADTRCTSKYQQRASCIHSATKSKLPPPLVLHTWGLPQLVWYGSLPITAYSKALAQTQAHNVCRLKTPQPSCRT
jgi:hypothetical protein